MTTERDDDTKPAAAEERVLLTENEAAEYMRWSPRKIQRLRLSGKLPYYPGKPTLVELSDLKALKIGSLVETKFEPPPPPPRDEKAEARERARQKWLLGRFRKQRRR